MKRQTRLMRGGLLGALALGALACGDPNMKESRGYTKAPLERPRLVTIREEPGEMARFGGPRRLNADRIELPEQAPPPAAGPAPSAPVELPPGVTQDMVAQGEQLYGSAGNCIACHAAGGTGTPLAPALNDGSWIHIDGSFDELVRIITDGVPTPAQFPAAMPPRGGGAITEEQVRQIAAYVYSLSR
jgi:mono/diheme cytochrome c family protein